MSGIYIQDVIENSPIETDVESTYLVTIKNGVIKKIAAGSLPLTSNDIAALGFVKSNAFGVILLCGLDNGNNLPGTELQAEIDRQIASGISPDKIVWFSTGTEVAGLDGIGNASGVFVTAGANAISGIGISIGIGILTGLSVATSVSDYTGTGTVLGAGLGSLNNVNVSLVIGEISGVGIALGVASFAEVSITVLSNDIVGSGPAPSFGIADVTTVSVVTSTGTLDGNGEIGGLAALASTSIVSSAGVIDSNTAPYATGITFGSFYEPVAGSATLTGVSAATTTGTITGTDGSGSGTLTDVSVSSSVGIIDSNAAPFATSITFNNFT